MRRPNTLFFVFGGVFMMMMRMLIPTSTTAIRGPFGKSHETCGNEAELEKGSNPGQSGDRILGCGRIMARECEDNCSCCW